MSSDSEDEYIIPDIIEKTKNTTDVVLPIKSRERYEIVYRKFMDWRTKNAINSFSENVLLAYFEELSTTMKPSSLWAMYSMLRTTLNTKYDNTDIGTYTKLMALLKRNSVGFKSKKSKALNINQIKDFLENAPDSKYLFMKVVLIIAVNGACTKLEMRSIQPEDVEDTGKSLIINITDPQTKAPRAFVVPETFYSTCKKYMNLRPTGEDTKFLPFFLNYINEKCIKQGVGINKFGTIPKQIAQYLGLPDAKEYTGHCFRRTSASIGRFPKIPTTCFDEFSL